MSPLRFPGLDQRVAFDRGEADVLGKHVGRLVLDMTHAPDPVPVVHLLTCLPLAGLARKLYQLRQREQAAAPRPGRRPKPRMLRVRYDELAALLYHREGLYHPSAPDAEHLLLHHIIGKFQQKSLSLSQIITF